MVSNIYNSGVSAFRRSKGFKTYVYNSLTTDISLVYPQGIEGSRLNISETCRVSRPWCFKGPKDSRDSGFQGIEGFPLLTGTFNELGVSKIQGFQGKYIYKIWTRSKYHRPCIVKPLCDLSSLWVWIGPMGERIPREGIRVWESIIRESADFTLLIIGNPGALLLRFLTTSLGCYSLRRSCNLSRGR